MALPRRLSGASEASSTACQLSSSTIRWRGSITAASRGEMPKKPASKSPTRSTKPPLGWRASSGMSVGHRSAGASEIASPPSLSSFQKARTSSAPGTRHDIPMTATAF